MKWTKDGHRQWCWKYLVGGLVIFTPSAKQYDAMIRSDTGTVFQRAPRQFRTAAKARHWCERILAET